MQMEHRWGSSALKVGSTSLKSSAWLSGCDVHAASAKRVAKDMAFIVASQRRCRLCREMIMVNSMFGRRMLMIV